MFQNKPVFKETDRIRPLLNVGCLFDIQSGYFVKGKYGENILNGGLSSLTGFTGQGNTFKSTIMHYLMLSAMEKVYQSGAKTYANTYDTELNMHIEHLEDFMRNFEALNENDLINNNYWSITDKSKHSGNEWFEKLKDFIKNDKIKNSSKYMLESPFYDPIKKELKMVLAPTFGEIDSLSEFGTDSVDKMQNENELGDSGANMLHMRLGAVKTRLLMELPVLCASGLHYTLISAHLGADNAVQQGPMNAPPPKKLQSLKMGEKIKGVTEKFFFLTNSFWKTISATPFINQTTKEDEYPSSETTSLKDLYTVNLIQLRSKSGPTGLMTEILVSQKKGVLPTLSEFNYVKNNDRFGIEGTLQHYSMSLYPDIKLSRTTVRGKIDSDPKLRRAINLTSELLQIKQYLPYTELEIPDPKDIYEKLKKDGYDWDVLLNTRGWWTFNNDKHPIPFLSSMDIVEMYHGVYKPYWLKG